MLATSFPSRKKTDFSINLQKLSIFYLSFLNQSEALMITLRGGKQVAREIRIWYEQEPF